MSRVGEIPGIPRGCRLGGTAYPRQFFLIKIKKQYCLTNFDVYV